MSFAYFVVLSSIVSIRGHIIFSDISRLKRMELAAQISNAGETSPVAVDSRLLSLEQESQLFWRLRRRLLKSTIADKLRTARLRISLIAFLSLFFWFGLFWLFYEGFRFLQTVPDIVPRLYNTFFASLFAMLMFSSSIILYSGLYRSAEAAFLLTQPVRPGRIFVYKFQEAAWFSSWGFILMGSPMLMANGLVMQAPWYYYALLLPFVVVFVYIPTALGAIACLCLVNWLPRLRVHALSIGGLLLCVGVIGIGWFVARQGHADLMTPRWFQEVSDRMRFTEQRLLPSWWLSAGLLEATRPAGRIGDGYQPWIESLLFLMVLSANALFFHQLAAWIAGRTYRAGYSRLQCEVSSRRKLKRFAFDDVLRRSMIFVPEQIRWLLIKELRIFRRDPVQWLQFVIFFGLLAIYFFNIPRFTYGSSGNIMYSAMIGFLNLAVVGLILSTFTTRFIFPMVSLEGKRFWILGLLPLTRDTILRVKFLFAAVGSLIPCSILILLSDWMLDMSPGMMFVHQVTCAALCLGLSSIAVGLGAIMPDLRENSPSKIAAGFGGTLNLVISALYIMLLVLLTAVPFHLRMAFEQGIFLDQSIHPIVRFIGSREGVMLGTLLTMVTGTIATLWPLRVGMRAFRELEF